MSESESNLLIGGVCRTRTRTARATAWWFWSLFLFIFLLLIFFVLFGFLFSFLLRFFPIFFLLLSSFLLWFGRRTISARQNYNTHLGWVELQSEPLNSILLTIYQRFMFWLTKLSSLLLNTTQPLLKLFYFNWSFVLYLGHRVFTLTKHIRIFRLTCQTKAPISLALDSLELRLDSYIGGGVSLDCLISTWIVGIRIVMDDHSLVLLLASLGGSRIVHEVQFCGISRMALSSGYRPWKLVKFALVKLDRSVELIKFAVNFL